MRPSPACHGTAGAPNVLVVLIDDTGFGNPGTFGGPISTPSYDRVAEQVTHAELADLFAHGRRSYRENARHT